MIFLAIFNFLIISAASHAGVEVALGSRARSYPASGIVFTELGYGMKIWGAEKSGPFYGFLKPQVSFQTAGTYNSGELQLKAFPISFLGVSGGFEVIQNDSDYKPFDCQTYACRGRYTRSFLTADFGMAVGWWILKGRAGIEDWRQKSHLQINFVEPSWGLVAQNDGDRLRFAMGATGLSIAAWKILYLYSYAEMEKVHGQAQNHLGLIGWNTNTWSVWIGGGAFQSELKPKDFTGIIRWTWQPLGTMELL